MPDKTRHSHSATKKIWAHIGALVTMIGWGSSFLSTKVLMNDGDFTPVEMFIYRFSIAYLLLLFLTFKKIFANNWKDEFQLFLAGLCAGSLYFITENYALKYTSAGNVSLLASISPIFITVLMAVIYKKRPGAGVILGSIIAFIGVACIIFSSGEGFEIRPVGDIFAICSALSWAIYTLLVKRLNPIYNSLFLTRNLFFYGVLTALPLLLIQHAPYHFLELFNFHKPAFGLNFLFLVLMCSVAAYLIWNESMKVLGPVKTNNYLYLQPLVTMVAAYFILDESIKPLGYVGCILILGGIYMSDRLSLKKD